MSRGKKARKASNARKRTRRNETIANAIAHYYSDPKRRADAKFTMQLASLLGRCVRGHTYPGPRPGEIIIEMPED